MLSRPFVRAVCALAFWAELAATAIVPAHTVGNSSWPYQTYKTANFTPPVLNMTGHPSSAKEYYFIAPDGATAFQPSPFIMDTTGNLVWSGVRQHAFSFGVQQYAGEQVLVAWNGTSYPEPIGRGNGAVTLWNMHYQQVAKVTLSGNFIEHVTPNATYESNIDLHEIYITPSGTMLITANNVTQTDLTSVGGPNDGWVVEAQVYEIDIATNEVLFSWKSLDHLDQLPFNASVYPLGEEGFDATNQTNAWGYFHINAVAPYNGGYVLSSRFLCSAIALDASGEVLWRLQGRDGGDFNLGDGANFCYQHDVRAVPPYSSKNGVVILHMFDNENSPVDNNTVPNAGKILKVDLKTKDVSLVQQYLNESGPIYATAQGNLQPLSSGGFFIGHGWIPVMEEFAASGEILSTIQFGAAVARPGGGFVSGQRGTLSYRAFKQPWVGCPKTKPAVVAEKNGNCCEATVYVSWNGATEVDSWAIYGGNQTLEYLMTVPKTGFETAASVPEVQYVQVRPILRRRTIPDCRQDVVSNITYVQTV